MRPAKTYLFTCRHFGLVVYGSAVLVGTKSIICRNALDETFDVPSNYRSLSMVRAVPHIRKCLTNPKLCHDGTDERDPNFDVFQDIHIQSQNYCSISQLNVMVMGYRGGMLRAQFCTNKINERKAIAPVMVAHTLEHQGKKFFLMGGEHAASENMFKAAEINRLHREATERKKAKEKEKEKEKKSQVKYHARCKAALPILDCLGYDLESNVALKELEILLKWKGVAVWKIGEHGKQR